MKLNTIYRTVEEITPIPQFTGTNLDNRKTPFKVGTDFWIDSVNNGVVVVESKSGSKYSFLEDEFSASTELINGE